MQLTSALMPEPFNNKFFNIFYLINLLVLKIKDSLTNVNIINLFYRLKNQDE